MFQILLYLVVSHFFRSQPVWLLLLLSFESKSLLFSQADTFLGLQVAFNKFRLQSRVKVRPIEEHQKGL
jgi:hypothetical protein